MALGLGLGISKGAFVSSVTLGQTMATAHYNRVIADGGVLPVGVSGLSSVLDSVIAAYSITSSSDFNTKVPVFLDPSYTGYKLGAGSGTTAGQAARTVYAISSSADVTQTTAASQPLLLAWSGVNYWWGSGVAGNYCSTPDNVANEITGDMDMIAYVDYKNNGNLQVIQGKSISGNFQYLQYITSSNELGGHWGNGGSLVDVNSHVSLGTTYIGWVKCSRVSLTGIVSFFTSSDPVTTTISSINWVSNGTPAISYIGTLGSSGNPVQIGGYNPSGTNFLFQGKIYRATISDSIGGAPVVDFNPSEYSAASSQTDWNSSTGERWTINTGTAATGYKGVIISKTIVMSDGIDDTLTSGTITNRQYYSQHVALNPFNILSSGGSYYVDGGGAKGLIYGNADSLIAYNGSDLNFIGDLEYRLQYCHADFNNTSSNIYLNNSNNVSGATGTQTTNKCNLFSNGSGGVFANAIVNTIISGNAIDTSTQRTSLYNIIRSMNGNAF